MTPRPAVLVAACAAALALVGCAGDPPAPVASPPPAVSTPAAAPERSGGFALVADGPGAVARSAAAPGAAAVVALRLANASDAERALTLTAEPAWLEVPPVVVVPARQSVPVTARAHVPPGAAGTLRGRVVARAEGDASAAVSVSYEASVDVAVAVGATP